MIPKAFCLATAITLALMCSPALEAQVPFCDFETIERGSLERAVKNEQGYEITLDQEIETFTIQINSTSPHYPSAEKIITEAAKAEAPTQIAVLFQNQQPCGFLSVTEDYAYVQKFHLRNGKYILDVCTDETDDCYSLTISPGNSLFAGADKLLPSFIHKVVYALFTENGEILEINIYE